MHNTLAFKIIQIINCLQIHMELMSLIDNEIMSFVFSGHSAHHVHVQTHGIWQQRTPTAIIELAPWNTDTTSWGTCWNNTLWTTHSQQWKHISPRCIGAVHWHIDPSSWGWPLAVRRPHQRQRWGSVCFFLCNFIAFTVTKSKIILVNFNLLHVQKNVDTWTKT